MLYSKTVLPLLAMAFGLGNTAAVPDVPELTDTLDIRDSADINAAAVCKLQAFSGRNCDGAAGFNRVVTRTPECIDLSGRWSYYLSPGCGATNVRVEYWTSSRCGGTRVGAFDLGGDRCGRIRDNVYSVRAWNQN